MIESKSITVGVLALQGSFREHVHMLNKLPGVVGQEVRTTEQLQYVNSLIIPGGESTTMALIAERWGLIPDLQEFAAKGNPIWGTCAGLIFLAEKATGQKEGGQALLGGLNCSVQRNFFGSQIHSFEAVIPAPPCLKNAGSKNEDFKAVFIRAPAVMEAGEGVEIIANYNLTPKERADTGRESVAIAVRKGALLATAFHPELTDDLRWHQMFADMTRAHVHGDSGSESVRQGNEPATVRSVEETACSSSAASEGWEQINVADDFSISVIGKEARISYEDKLVARAVLSGAEVDLKLEPSLQGRRNFPMDGFMKAYKKAQYMLNST